MFLAGFFESMIKIAIYFHCDTCNPFSLHSCRETAGINVKMVIQKVGKDPEQNLMGCFDEFKIYNRILHYFKRKNIPQNRDTHGMEWPCESHM